MFGFARKQSPLLGIDIGSAAVKLLELGPAAGKGLKPLRVEALALEPLPSGAVVEKKIADAAKVGQAITIALRRSRSKTKRAAVAVAGSAVMTKVLSLGADLSDAEMEAQIQLESDQYVPYPLDEVNLDFDVIGPTQGAVGMVDVLLAASRRENIDDRVAALEHAGLSAVIVDIESNAVETAFSALRAPLVPGLGTAPGTTRLTAIADIGATTTTLHVLRAGQTLYTREQSFGGQQLIDEVQRCEDLMRDPKSDQGSEQALARLAAAPPTRQAEVLAPFQNALARQLGRALQFFYSTTAFNSVDEVLLTGGVTQVPALERPIAESLALPVRIVDPLAEMALSDDLDRNLVQNNRGAMLIALGLALRRFR
ncbi:type IV pilus assembly protein PilM [Halochromatium salexigens]|uniref:Pilus assembly protein PilM n=1 Tax=Halochromatium salexigens TaxID=49447 RepID=A0AAJ0UI76_HALSE|nr:type IV pilus assembly protein PilM [Halochromatium salexigens]MBK5931748.1 pilus assembly protein PilM [Halochromatium salexigens]